MIRWSTLFVACGLTSPVLAATTTIQPGDDVAAAVRQLGPGDELVLTGGVYAMTGRLGISVAGTASEPIVIRSRSGEVAVIERSDANQNTIDIDSAEWLVIRGIEVRGGSHGIRIRAARHLTIEDSEVHDTEDVGISANVSGSEYVGLILRRNHVHHTGGTGEGFYLGCNDDACRLLDSQIVGNWVHDTNHGVSQGDGIELKIGSAGNVIADNVVHDTGYPCILAYGTNGRPRNTIERNVMWGCGDHAIQVAADAVVRNNIILGAAGAGIASQPHQGASPSQLDILHNTIVVSGDALTLRNVAGPITVANNALYGGARALLGTGNLSATVVSHNIGQGSIEGFGSGVDTSGTVAGDFVDVPQRLVFPSDASKLRGTADPAYLVSDDFEGHVRVMPGDVGAYATVEERARWTPGPEFKVIPELSLPDAGLGDAPNTDGGSIRDARSNADATESVDAETLADSGVASSPDVGGTSDAGSAADASSTIDAGVDAGKETTGEDGSCHCQAESRNHYSHLVWASLGLLFRTRRRRRE